MDFSITMSFIQNLSTNRTAAMPLPKNRGITLCYFQVLIGIAIIYKVGGESLDMSTQVPLAQRPSKAYWDRPLRLRQPYLPAFRSLSATLKKLRTKV